MSKFIEIEQNGKVGYVNADHIVLVLPSSLVGTTQLITINGMALDVKGSVAGITAMLSVQERPRLSFR